MGKEVLFEARDVYKSFGGNHVLKGINFALERGEVHAILGINGAGKSTFIKIMSGALQMDRGEMEIDGKTVTSFDPRTAKEHGIVTIYQETSLYMDLSVLENLFVGKMIHKGLFIDWKEMERQASAVLDRMGVQIPLYAKLGDLGKATAQLVEIAKCLIGSCKILIMDEPTASLSRKETENLFQIINKLKAEGKSIIYISHKMEEIYEITDRVTIFRDGVVTGTRNTAEATHEWVSEQMLGVKLEQEFHPLHEAADDVVLEVKGLCSDGVFENISFQTKKGEILALVGLIGSGRTEVARAIFGVDHYDRGEVIFHGETLKADVLANIRRGMAMVPEDRGRQGLILQMMASENMCLSSLPVLSKAGVRNFGTERDDVKGLSDKLLLSPNDPSLTADSFSGGNQQKIVIGKWLETKPSLLIIDEPTCGVDIGAKMEIYKLLSQLCQEGISVLMISSDFEEVQLVADRILVMRNGRIVNEMANDNLSAKDILQYALAG